jgi:DNA-binding CsgD family transcriptional regulator
MDESEQTSQLIGEIYDAALDRALWPSVLERTSRFVQGACAAIVAQNPIADSAQFYFSWGVDPEQERSYVEKYVRLNPATLASMCRSSNVGQIESTGTVMSLAEFHASRFYLEWARPQGYCDSVWAILERSSTAMAAVSVLRHERHGIVDDATRRRMGILAPHFRRAVAIGKTIDLRQIEAAALADTLDGLAAAVFLVGDDAHISHANAAAQALLAQDLVLRGANATLVAVEASAQRALQAAVAAAASGDVALGTKGIGVPLAGGKGDRWIAHVLPLTAGVRRHAGAAYSAVAAVFVRKAQLDLPHPIETIAAHYKLTPAELRVLMAIVEIGGVPEVAPVLGISETTVKTHLQRVFEKTGTSRQADLVKLVAGFMSPLGDERTTGLNTAS